MHGAKHRVTWPDGRKASSMIEGFYRRVLASRSTVTKIWHSGRAALTRPTLTAYQRVRTRHPPGADLRECHPSRPMPEPPPERSK